MNKSSDQELKALDALIIDNPDLERLEALLDQFNIFEALNTVRVEVRNSDFLTFLLNPAQNHGLGDTFVKRLLQKALSLGNTSLPFGPVDLDVWDLDGIVVQREWQNIDILLVDEEHKLVVTIENKVDSGEHSDQLKSYCKIVLQHYPGWNYLWLFLTPDGTHPSDDRYVPISYQVVCEIIERLIEARSSTLKQDVRILMAHYTQMLRRHIVEESEIAELCKKIYHKHQRALDLIYEYVPDRQNEVSEILKKLVLENPILDLDRCVKTGVNFGLKEWDVPILLQGQGWSPSGRILLFEFANNPNNFNLHLIIGPGPIETRQKLFNMASLNHPFKPAFKVLGKNWSTIFVRSFLTSSVYQNALLDQLEEEIRKKWDQFLEHDLPEIRAALLKEDWIWKQNE